MATPWWGNCHVALSIGWPVMIVNATDINAHTQFELTVCRSSNEAISHLTNIDDRQTGSASGPCRAGEGGMGRMARHFQYSLIGSR